MQVQTRELVGPYRAQLDPNLAKNQEFLLCIPRKTWRVIGTTEMPNCSQRPCADELVRTPTEQGTFRQIPLLFPVTYFCRTFLARSAKILAMHAIRATRNRPVEALALPEDETVLESELEALTKAWLSTTNRLAARTAGSCRHLHVEGRGRTPLLKDAPKYLPWHAQGLLQI